MFVPLIESRVDVLERTDYRLEHLLFSGEDTYTPLLVRHFGTQLVNVWA